MTILTDTVAALKAQNADLTARLTKLEATQPPSGDVAAEITALQAGQTTLQTQITNIDNLTPDAAPAAPVA